MDPEDLTPEPDDTFVRGLLGEVGREPEPLPDDVAARLDDRLAGLVAERDAASAGTPAVVVPAAALERARRRRRRGLSVLAAAAAVVVGGYTVTTVGLVQGGGADAGTAADADVASGAEEVPEPARGALDGDSFALSSGSLRADARRLVASDDTTLNRLTESRAYAANPLPQAPDLATDGDTEQDEVEKDELGATSDDAGGGSGADPEVPVARGPQDVSSCADPLAPARLPRLAVTYDGRDATAVLRRAAPGADGRERVRVEVWDCAAPLVLAQVVVPR